MSNFDQNINEVFGQGQVEQIQEEYKAPTLSPFNFINSINFTKENLIVDEWSEKQYAPYIVNKGLSFNPETVIFANEMNSRGHIDRKLQYDFLREGVRARKRFDKWIKPLPVEDLDAIKTYFNYSNEKAIAALMLLSKEQIDIIKGKLASIKGYSNEKK